MNYDFSVKASIGILGTVGSTVLSNFNEIAAGIAAICTAIFMIVQIYFTIKKNLKKKGDQPPKPTKPVI